MMWRMLKMMCVVGVLVSGVFVIYGLVKLGRADEARNAKPNIESGVPGVEITKAEPTSASDLQSQALMILFASGGVLAVSVVGFGYAVVKGKRQPSA